MAVPIQMVLSQFIDANGPMASAKLYTYQAGTTTNLATYTTAAAGTANANPVIMDSRGEPDSNGIFLIPGDSYKFVLKDSNDATIWTQDNIPVPTDLGFGTDSGSANTYAVTLANDPVTLQEGVHCVIKITSTNTGASTLNLNAIGAKNIVTTRGETLAAGQLTTGQYYNFVYDGTNDRFIVLNPAYTQGEVLQVVSSFDGAVATGTTTLPNDDTIPQITEGDQYLSKAITPVRSDSTLIIESIAVLSSSAATGTLQVALFQDSTANALASNMFNNIGADNRHPVPLRYSMTSGTTSSTTFRIRGGNNVAATTTFNGSASSRNHGGVLCSHIIITEVAPTS